SAAMEDRLHLRPLFINSSAKGLGAPAAATGAAGAAGGGAAALAGAGAAGAAGGGTAGAGAPSPRSHGRGWPVRRHSMSSSVSRGRPLRLRYACSAAITELFSAFRGQAGSLPSTPFTV